MLAKVGGCLYTPPVARLSGVLAQLVERLNGIEEVSGSNPLCSSLRFFGEKTSAWQAIWFAKPNFFT